MDIKIKRGLAAEVKAHIEELDQLRLSIIDNNAEKKHVDIVNNILSELLSIYMDLTKGE